MIIVNDNEPKRHKRGDVREDGKIFWKANRWLTPEKFEQYRKAHAEGVKRYCGRNREERREYSRKWYSENKEVHKEYGYKWAKENRDKTREIWQRYKKRHPDRVAAHSNRWKKNNPIKVKIMACNSEAKRRARMEGTSAHLNQEQQAIVKCFYDQAQRLQKRLGIKFHVDHIIPLSKGGMHIPTNLQVLPASINVRKHAREIFRWCDLQPN
jgi:5-methylcytosine-specific restriction endonuclease McrA